MGCRHLGFLGEDALRCNDGIVGTCKSSVNLEISVGCLTILLGDIPTFHGLLAPELLIFFVGF